MDPSMRRLLGAPGTARSGASWLPSEEGAEGGRGRGREGGGGVLLLCRRQTNRPYRLAGRLEAVAIVLPPQGDEDAERAAGATGLPVWRMRERRGERAGEGGGRAVAVAATPHVIWRLVDAEALLACRASESIVDELWGTSAAIAPTRPEVYGGASSQLTLQ